MAITKSIPTVIKSIQRGVITIANASATQTATITAVDTTRSALKFLGRSYAGDTKYAYDTSCYLVLTNSTTVTATRQGTTTALYVSYEVTEYV